MRRETKEIGVLIAELKDREELRILLRKPKHLSSSLPIAIVRRILAELKRVRESQPKEDGK